jgi:LAO/AO transport system kinase
VGITGVPGAGKSTFIDALGRHLIAAGRRVAVLAVDPSSHRTGGSILGDRTRMAALAAEPAAFIRPSPSAGELGGIAAATQDAIVLVEAAGFDVVLVETVGVGQSETAVADVVDTFLLLVVPGTGDELQALKMGVLERTDLIAVNKDDGDNRQAARAAARQLRSALRLVGATRPGPVPAVLTCSAADGFGVPEVWRRLGALHEERGGSGARAERRAGQRLTRMHTAARAALLRETYGDPAVAAVIADVEAAVRRGAMTGTEGAVRIVAAARGRTPTQEGPTHEH